MFIKKFIGTILVNTFAIILTTCATTSGSNLSLLDVIEQAAERIASELPTGSRVAVLAFESDSENLSTYIMEELVGALHAHKIEVADRENLPYLQRELDFQLSGEISDESALSIGRFLGAQMAITGQMRNLGDTYRFTTNAISIETAVLVSIPRLMIRNDRELQNMMTSLNNQTTVIRTARYAVSAEPQTAGAFFDRGISLASQGMYDEAIRNFSEAIQINQNMSGAYFMRGRAYHVSVSNIQRVGTNFSGIMAYTRGVSITAEQSRAYDLALADFSRAISLDPYNDNIYNERASVYLDKGNYDRAIADITEAIRINPNSARLYSNRAVVYDMMGNYDRAIADHTEALRLDPNSADSYLVRGNTYLQRDNRGDTNLAIADFTDAIRLNSMFADAYVSRSNAYMLRNNSGDLDRAMADATHAIQLEPNSRALAAAYISRAIVYSMKEDYDRAIADATQAIQLTPNEGMCYTVRGLAYANKGDFDRAIVDFETALQINPDDPEARLYIQQVRQMRRR